MKKSTILQNREQIQALLAGELLKRGLISQKELSRIQEENTRHEPLEVLLYKENWIPGRQLTQILSHLSGYAMVDLTEHHVESDILDSIPAKLITKHHILPLKLTGQTLTIATNRLFDITEEDRLRLLVKHAIHWVLAGYREIEEHIKFYYGIGLQPMLGMEGDATISDGPQIENFVHEVIADGVEAGATDIHIEPFQDKLRLRYRIDGVLCPMPLPQGIEHYQKAIVAATKVLTQVKFDEQRLPQDGRFSLSLKNRSYDFRVSILPTRYGQTLNIRVLNRKATFLNIEELGMQSGQLHVLKELLERPNGIVLFTGPTGSGKTTSLYASLAYLNNQERKIITLEDPVEYQIEGITQMQIHNDIGFTFASGLRSILRHDPDVVLIGEIRDPETAEIAISAAQTGHLVFSTLHTNDSPSAITRLLDMGIEPYMVASSLQAVVAQRLVRVLCPACRKEADPEAYILKEIEVTRGEIPKSARFYRPHGCSQCRFTGYNGRQSIFEVLLIDDFIRKLTVAKADSSRIMATAKDRGMQTLRASGWANVLEGQTTVDEILRITMSESKTAFKEDLFQ